MRSNLLFPALLLCAATASSQPHNRGYYRFPAVHDQTVVFTAEGDLWEVRIDGGAATRLTSHLGDETHAAFSPDGKTIAFSADYEGPTEVYTMPAVGGLPARRTFGGGSATVMGWTSDGRILYSTSRYATLPAVQLATLDAENRAELLPLSQASQGCFDSQGKILFFTRLPFQGSYTKRYKGGSVENLWKYRDGAEAAPLTPDYAGISKNAMWWNGRVYFLSDRDGTMNLWSMDENGKGLKQHTHHQGWDLTTASLGQGRIVYAMSGDLFIYDIASATEKKIPIDLASDFDHLREHWIKNPIDYITAAHISPDGSRVAFTARGKAFVAPVKGGRFVEVPARHPGRYRDARFMPDGKSLLILSSETGEVEFWKVPANGTGDGERLTTDGKVLRWEGIPSPDGKWIVHQDKDDQLWLLATGDKTQKRIATVESSSNTDPQFESVRWSPDSRWITFAEETPNLLSHIVLYNVETGVRTPLTTDRYESRFASWSRDGKWIYFISDRALRSVTRSPWGPRQPDPYFDRSRKIYLVALQKGLRSPFEPADELHPDKTDTDNNNNNKPPAVPKVEIDVDGIAARLQEVPLPPANYSDLAVSDKRICWLDNNPATPGRATLECLDIANKGAKPETILSNTREFEMSADGKKLLIRHQPPGSLPAPPPPPEFFVIDTNVKGTWYFDDHRVELKDWTFPVIPADEFREAFVDAWRLHRDYFYDRNMHGVNWKAMRDKYGELVGRVRDREELSDLISQMVAELSTLHTFVRGGDVQRGLDQVQLGTLGARLERDADAGGYVVKHIYRSDPDRPDRQSPLARPGVDVAEGDVLLSINGQELRQVADPGEMLRNQAGKQVLLRVKPKGQTETRDVVAKPLNMQQDADLRYAEWEYTRRLEVEKASSGKIGYVHLRAMGQSDIDQWSEQYIPVFDRDGLIIDVRHNGGGSIDSWILDRLMRKAWMYWQSRIGHPYWNMQEAFRGHMVVLCDQNTGSDGEAFTEGFRRLGLGKIIGMRTWGGEIWLSSQNYLADKGIATTGEDGVFGPEGKWLIEGRGVEPDIVVDNLPHATFEGEDAQLDAAIKHLQQLIREKPIPQPQPPKYPDKSFHYSSEGH